MTSMRMKAVQGIHIGDQFSVTRTFTEEDTINFAKTSRDYNPVHFEDRFVKAKQFKGKICHGLLVGSMLTQIGGQLGWLATEMDFKFRKPVYFGDTITCELTIHMINAKGLVEAGAVFTNSDGVVVVEAVVKGNLPGESEREVMKLMVKEGDSTNRIS
ncbi:MAG: MaoC family dehydratase [Deltaproteobacteria bacterium]|nr:MaoC family dehydratase [Deltaproteobacteria bacterium]